jgi:hypothetical protein
MLVNLKLSLAVAAAFAASSDAVVVDLFSDTDCNVPAGNRNVWDNTCAPTGGFQSYRITYGGTIGQTLRAHSRNACVVPYTSCVSGSYESGRCERATNGNGGSNALSSYFGLCD